MCAEIFVVASLVYTNCFSQHYQAAIRCMWIAQQVRKCSGDSENYIWVSHSEISIHHHQTKDVMERRMMLHSLHHRKIGWGASLYLTCTYFKITNTADRFLFAVF